MLIKRHQLFARCSAVIFSLSGFLTASHALAQDSDVYKVGILTDMSGPYSAMGGPGSVVAAKMGSRIA